MPPKSNALEQQLLLVLARMEGTFAGAMSRMEGNIAKLDEQVQCIRATLSEIEGGMQMLIEAQVADDDDDDEEDEDSEDGTTTEGDSSDSDMSYVVPDHSSSSGSYDTDDSF